MVASLLAKLRARYPDARIAVILPAALAPLFAGRPWGVEAVPFDPRRVDSLMTVLRRPPPDLALVPGDNRYGWLALAAGARWIVGFDGDRPPYKSWCFDELRPYSNAPAAWTDMVATLIDGPPPTPYRSVDWPSPPASGYPRPEGDYVVLHVGARSPLKLWPEASWRALISALQAAGEQPVLTCGPGENAALEALADLRLRAYPGTLTLIQLRDLLAGARAVICPDNGVGHLARVAGTPTVCLFGPGSALLFGAGGFWSRMPFAALSVDVPCRDQPNLFKRVLPWVRTCERFPPACPRHVCMPGITPADVFAALTELLEEKP